jgi:hypothetical protein
MNLSSKILLIFMASSMLNGCVEEKRPMHIVGEVVNLNREELTILYVAGSDTILTWPLTIDTIQSTPFANDVSMLLETGNKTYAFNEIPTRYINDIGILSISRKVYYDDIFPEEWKELTERNIDYVTIKFVVSPSKRFTIVLSASTGIEIGRYFEKMN